MTYSPPKPPTIPAFALFLSLSLGGATHAAPARRPPRGFCASALAGFPGRLVLAWREGAERLLHRRLPTAGLLPFRPNPGPELCK